MEDLESYESKIFFLQHVSRKSSSNKTELCVIANEEYEGYEKYEEDEEY